jgi:hypothetical protein
MSFYRATEMPELEVSGWCSTAAPLTMAELRGCVVLICAFQMLCEGCVTYALPQAQRVYDAYSREDVVVLGLHTVFESHGRMGDEALRRFLLESGYTFPVAVDAPGLLWTPRTMEKLGLQGTPSLVLVDRAGRRRMQKLGHVADEVLWREICALVG